MILGFFTINDTNSNIWNLKVHIEMSIQQYENLFSMHSYLRRNIKFYEN